MTPGSLWALMSVMSPCPEQRSLGEGLWAASPRPTVTGEQPLFWGGSRQGSRGGEHQEPRRAPRGARGRAGTGRRQHGQGPREAGQGRRRQHGQGAEATRPRAEALRTRECLRGGAQDAGTLMGTEAGWEMGFVEKWSL